MSKPPREKTETLETDEVDSFSRSTQIAVAAEEAKYYVKRLEIAGVKEAFETKISNPEHFRAIASILKETDMANWDVLANKLEASPESIRRHKQQLFMEMTSQYSIIISLLESWLQKKSSLATIQKLLDILASPELGLKVADDKLRLYYNLPCKGYEDPKFHFNSMEKAFQDKVVQKLNEFFEPRECEKIQKNLHGIALVYLLMGKKPEAADIEGLIRDTQ